MRFRLSKIRATLLFHFVVFIAKNGEEKMAFSQFINHYVHRPRIRARIRKRMISFKAIYFWKEHFKEISVFGF